MSKKKKTSPVPAGSESVSVPGSSEAIAKFPGLDETPEPTVDRSVTPVILIAVLALLLYSCDMYLVANSGDFSAQVYSPYNSLKDLENAHPADPAKAQANKGRMIYKTYCIACHQENGQGAAGQFPPLAGSEWVLAEGPNRIIRVVLHGAIGPITVKGGQFNNNMLAWGPALDDEQIASVLTYVRGEWGNKASAIKPEQVTKIRKVTLDRSGYWTAPELLNVPEKD